jgi:preprotein translocase subunit SecE
VTDTRTPTTQARRPGGDPDRNASSGIRGIPARASLFYRQVVAELRKVIWPTRTQLITYTIVVIVFVTIMVAVLALLDFAFSWAVLKVFG